MICINSVSVSPSSISIKQGSWYYGACASIYPTNASCKDVTWSSSNTSVATVNATSGLVTAQQAGCATIYATANDGSGVSGNCVVTVNPLVPIESITVCPSSKTMKVGEAASLNATICPFNATNKSVTWCSSNLDVATVGLYTGKVTAKSVGTTVITATTSDGNQHDTCIISILAPEIINNFIVSKTIDASDIKCTDDGLYIMTVSLSDLFTRNGIQYLYEYAEGDDKRDVTTYYDDWYMYALESETSTKYGLYKMREQENDNIDGDSPGVTVSFIGLSSNSFKACFYSPTQENTYTLLQDLDRVTGPGIYEHDNDIAEYFAKTESKGAYLIAEEYVYFIAKTSVNGVLNVPDNYRALLDNIAAIDAQLENVWLDSETRLVLISEKNKLMRIPNWLIANNEKAGYNVYDSSTKTIRINNINCLSIYEKYAILATFTADVNFNMFAAEVEFHADAIYSWEADIPWLGDAWYEAAIRADMAINEEDESGYYDEYYDLDGELVKAQAEVHGAY